MNSSFCHDLIRRVPSSVAACSQNNTQFLAAAVIQEVDNFCCCIAWLGLRGNSCKQHVALCQGGEIF
jgi:hypothetical protein